MPLNRIRFHVAAAIFVAAAAVLPVTVLPAQNPLFIPDTLTGPAFNLSVQTGGKTFFPGFTTPTHGYNGGFLGPTLLMNKGDSVSINVTNNLPVSTTVHWHGFHVAAMNDGGPHQLITAGSSWNPAFKVRNEAGTFWYHPHGDGKTEVQVTRGLAGLIIVRDSVEAGYDLPRHYGVDDFPLILQTKAFDVLYQFAIANHEDSVMMVNGTMDAFLAVPQQVVRFRLLNGSTDRTYLVGLSDGGAFHLIASDGGLLSAPLAMNRLRISPGERAEILVDFGGYTVGQSVDLMSFASELPQGIIGADSVGLPSAGIAEGYYDNPLNGVDFSMLRLDVVAATANPVTAVPAAFAPLVPMDTAGVDAHRAFHFSSDTLQFGPPAQANGPFSINNQAFVMDTINFTVPLDNKEIWTLTNSTEVAHPFHLHDVQFFVVDINGVPPPAELAGLKDVILVEKGDTVRFVTEFGTFADDEMPYMYHCHLLHHEDDGMMGQFLVVNPGTGAADEVVLGSGVRLFPNPTTGKVGIRWDGASQRVTEVVVFDVFGRMVFCVGGDVVDEVDLGGLASGVYLVRVKVRGGWVNCRVVRE